MAVPQTPELPRPRTLLACLALRHVLPPLAILSLATVQGCGSNSDPPKDGATDVWLGSGGVAGGGGTGGSPTSTGGSTGFSADVGTGANADGAVPIVDCENLTCLNAAASLIATCKPDNACTYQYVGATVTHCFSNGVTISQTWIPSSASAPVGQEVMAVKRNGVLCYSLNVANTDATGSSGTLTYVDATGVPMVTLFADSNNTTVTCPGGATVAIAYGGSCGTAIAALGGLMPASSCSSGTEGTCVF